LRMRDAHSRAQHRPSPAHTKMAESAVAVDAELIKWWDALDVLAARLCSANCAKAVLMARGCRHPEAQWLLTLLPRGEAVTLKVLRDAVVGQTSGCGLYLAWELDDRQDAALLLRAAELEYARAQALLASKSVASADVLHGLRARPAEGSCFVNPPSWSLEMRSTDMASWRLASSTGRDTCDGGVRRCEECMVMGSAPV
jgi:hypothetical protein